MNILGLILSTIGVGVVAIIIANFIWTKTRKKKKTWNARIWMVGEGIRKYKVDSSGDKMSNIKLSDLRPYAKDILVKEELDKGITSYHLMTLNKSCPAVTSDVEHSWGKGEKEVNVLFDGDSCTLLKNGYDRSTGEAIWQPLSYDRINSLKNDIEIRRSRIRKNKDILMALMPYITIVMALMVILGFGYFAFDTTTKVSKEITKQEEMRVQAIDKQTTEFKDMMITISNNLKEEQQLINEQKENINKYELPKIE